MILKKKTLKIAFIIAVLISLAFLIKTTDLQKVISSVRLIGFRFVFIILLTFIAYLFATIGWKFCFKNNARTLSIMDLFFIRHIGEMVSLINPAGVIGGEAMKIHMLQNKGIDKAEIVASVLISRVMMAVTQVLIFMISLAVVYSSDASIFDSLPRLQPKSAFAITLIILLLLTLGKSIAFRQKLKNTKLYTFIKSLAFQWKLKTVFGTFRSFFRNDLKSLAGCTFFFSLHWIIGSMEIYFILLFLGIKAGFFQVLLVDMGIVLFKSAGAFVPGQIGVEEIGNKVMLKFIGIPDNDVWITVSVLRRSRQLFWIAFGLIVYLIYTRKIRNQPNFS